MNLKQSPNKKTGRTYLSIVRGYRDKETGKVRAETIESLGYLDELEKLYEDPIAHFKEAARRMTEEENEKNRVALSFDMNERLAQGTGGRKNFGYAALLKIYHELELDRFFKNKARHEGFRYNTNSIMTLLIVSRVLSPGSKKKAFEEKGRYFERFDFSLDDTYRSLSHFAATARDALRHVHEKVSEKYGRDTKTVYYDVTNFYFEIDEEDELRKKGVSKEHRPNPIVQMGLAADADGIPICYKTFPGNTHDSQTFRDVIGEIAKNYDAGRIVVVADKGVIGGDNIYYLKGGDGEKRRNGYVFSFSVRGGTDAFKRYVQSEKDYEEKDGKPADENSEFKIKTRIAAREINVTMRSGKTERKTVYERQVVFWSEKHAGKAKKDRENALKKAFDLVADPAKYNARMSKGAAKYVKNLVFDKETGEIVPKDGQIPAFDFAKLAEEERYDGYYAIVTSELDMPKEQIVETYRGLWEIEESFRISKGELEARPVYVRRRDRIEAHFLTCFIALTILRILQKKTGRAYSAERIVDCLNRVSCSEEHGNLFLFDWRSDVSDALGAATGIDFTKKRMRLAQIKSAIGAVKARE
jgi:transposase